MRGPATFSPDDVVVGHSARMRAIFDFVKVVSRSDSSVIITGESGTGKEVIANLLHYSSSRRHQPFVAVSCALFSENLIETELFGHERGAFTGAIKDKPGRFEMAQGGTLFLDDIDDVPLSMQVKLLRAIQNRTVERVGGTRAINVNVRIITGSKRDLKQMVAEGNFREDLYYRLNVLPIVLPPLRERREDIPVLTDFFFRKFARARGIEPPAVSPAVRYAFSRYRWPGNVRELENSCERIVQTCGCGTVRTGCLAANMLFGASSSPGPGSADLEPSSGPASISLDDRLREVESNLISWALKVSDGNKSRAAELLGIKRSTLGDRIVRCGLADPAPDGAAPAPAVAASAPAVAAPVPAVAPDAAAQVVPA
jgi:transcriptional regulator with GAF, ATPase, and Fis domain